LLVSRVQFIPWPRLLNGFARRPIAGGIKKSRLTVPSAWFFIEYIFLYRHFGKAGCFKSFQYAQEIVAKGWIGLVVVMSILLLGKEILRKDL
jgi:hypothetical protein